MTQNVFILSSGRTGTLFLAEFFKGNYSSVHAVHEPAPSYHLRMLSNARLAGLVSDGILRGALRISRQGVLRSLKADLYIESNPFLCGFVDVLDALGEKPAILHIMRDPREFVRSALNHGSGTGIKNFVSSTVPFWFTSVGSIQREHNAMSDVGKFAAQWLVVNQFLSEHGEPKPGYHRLKFEDVFDGKNSGLREICNILGLAYPGDAAPVKGGEKINAGRLNVMGKWPTWSDEQAREVDRVCGPLMRKYGYGDEPEWQAKIG